MENIQVNQARRIRISDDYGTNAVMYDLDQMDTDVSEDTCVSTSLKFGCNEFLKSAVSSGYLV